VIALAVSPEAILSPAQPAKGRFVAILLSPGLWAKQSQKRERGSVTARPPDEDTQYGIRQPSARGNNQKPKS